MSTWVVRPLQCPCGERFTAQLADGLHITKLPHVREAILAGTFHNVTCPACRVTRVVQTKTLYTDFDRMHWVAVAPPWLAADWETWAAVTQEEFDRNMRVAAPPMIQEIADDFRVRVVFGLDALAEKLRIWDAGMDDSVVEALKMRLVAEQPQLAAPGFRLRFLERAPDAWRLRFTVAWPGFPEHEIVEVDADAYLDYEGRVPELRETVPTLFEPPFVSLDRHFADTFAAWNRPDAEVQVLGPLRPQDVDTPLFPQ